MTVSKSKLASLIFGIVLMRIQWQRTFLEISIYFCIAPEDLSNREKCVLEQKHHPQLFPRSKKFSSRKTIVEALS